ncbi:murein biosynthesis integral membrane protein MurJ [Xinfangfangia sp. D13-10-4-6]|uniref:murein biosynthesis integral membrane protein MurJ n=1 Tax=Pseudogemmobacter hezensis TaxID=2737662 RepID=UPI001553798B|nr:murein biosynthesis integral membrane protein MurJ [Pseudogemmobacter hezensis]NPD14191.1 murein biosynthesis integral membrane protein MurJ [Pseudogemmobacter hezensis]
MKPIRLVAGFLTVGFWTLISRVAGLVRDMFMSAYLGDGPVAQAFVVAQSLPNMFRRLFAEGAFNMAFVPMYSKKLEGGEDANGFARDAYWSLAAFLAVFSAIAIVIMPALVWAMASGFQGDPRFDLAVTMGRIAFPYILFISLTALLSGVLNSMGRFLATSAVTILLSATMIVGMILARRFGWDMGRTLAWSVSVSGVLQLAFTWWALRRVGFTLPFQLPKWTPELKRLAIIAAPAALAGGVVQVNLIVGRQVASYTDGAITWLYNADRLYQLPLGVVGIAIGVVLLPEISRRLRAEDPEGAQHSFSRGAEFALLLTLPAAVALIVIARPIIGVIFERGAYDAHAAHNTALALAVYGAGLPAFVLHKVLQPQFYARHDTRRPFNYAVISMVVNAVLAIALMPLIGFLAAAIATSAAGWIMVVQLWLGSRRMGASAQMDARFRRRLPRIILSSLVMGAVLLAMMWGLGDAVTEKGSRTPLLLAMVLVGMGSYFATASLTGAMSLADLKASLRRGKRG